MVTRFSMGVKSPKMCFIIPYLWPVNTQSGDDYNWDSFWCNSLREWRNFEIAFFGFGIEMELFSSEKLENDTNFS